MKLRDEYGWTLQAGILLLTSTVLAFAIGMYLLIYLSTPRDSHGNPLPCLHARNETTVIIVGKIPVIETIPVCDRYGK